MGEQSCEGAEIAHGYTNPVIPGFHPDPSVCRVGDEYFLAASSFTYFPGVPIFRSRNLVDWTPLGSALDRPSQLDLTGTERSGSLGIFAPTLRHHDGRFWMITTIFRSPGGPQNFFVTAERPDGPWSEPTVVALPGIDPDLAWDNDGICWVHFSDGNRVFRARIDTETGAILDGPHPTWSGTGLQYPEAPHLFEREGTWYLLIAEGGTERGHGVSIARAPSVEGPWESCPANPILSHRSTNRPVQNTGHADLIEAPDGSWWMVLLGTRPRGGSPMFHVLGRETFLAPVQWLEGWPTVEPVELSVGRRPPGPGLQPGVAMERDDFDGLTLDSRWLAVRRPPNELAATDRRPGHLTVLGTEATLDDARPGFVGRRQQHERCRVAASVDIAGAGEAGLAVRMDERSHYEVALIGDRVVAKARIGPLSSVVGEAPSPGRSAVLFVETKDGGLGPDRVVLGYQDANGEDQVLATLDGRYLSTEVAGGMLGRVIGMYAVGGAAEFDWFEYGEMSP